MQNAVESNHEMTYRFYIFDGLFTLFVAKN